jgi:hypothetical protein
MFATFNQEIEHIRAIFNAQDAAGVIPAATASEADTFDKKRAAMLEGTYRPPCGCDQGEGPTPCDAAVLQVLSPEHSGGCPNVDHKKG